MSGVRSGIAWGKYGFRQDVRARIISTDRDSRDKIKIRNNIGGA